ncbi:flagellar basal body rod protein FlgC [Spartinivicinus ruber]|uniref:flagellar basal body rod protein FlgC n=1 Tax=Spartinivicinus ruber TaxID=2683272 RepID=UPI0013D5EB41|nr:flagellar basal body rod protein FlgC [Spartinivicinus ruber]
MDLANSFDISLTGLQLEKLRVNTVALNLANANTVAKADEEAFKAVEVVVENLTQQLVKGIQPEAIQLVEKDQEPLKVYDPTHPLADDAGFIRKPNINPTNEMLTLMTAVRSYEANLQVLKASRQMALMAIDPGKA